MDASFPGMCGNEALHSPVTILCIQLTERKLHK